MDQHFVTALQSWQTFQSAVASVTATLLGLIFVAAAIHPAIFSEAEHPDFLSLGLNTLGMFMFTLIIALILLIPHPSPNTIGVPVILMALVAIVTIVQHLMLFNKQLLNEWGAFFIFRRFILPVFGCILLLAVGFAVIVQHDYSFHFLAAVQLLFIFTAAYNAWDLLIHIGKKLRG